MKQDNLFDRTLKMLSRHYSHVFLDLLFPEQPIRLLGTVENVELNVGIRPVDFVHQIAYDDNPAILHLEFQLRHETDFPRRFCYYHGALTEQFSQPVLSVAIYLKPRRSPIPNEYVAKLGEQVINRFTYPVIKLWDYVEQIKSGQYWQFAPLLVTLVNHPDQTVLDQERQLIFSETNEKRRADLLAMAVTIANRYFDRNFLWKFFSKEVELMRQSSWVEEWVSEMAEARVEEQAKKLAIPMAEKMAETWQQQLAPKLLQQGMQQGMQRGVEQGIRQAIVRTLRIRFTLADDELSHLNLRLEKITDLAMLDNLAETSLRCFSFADFQAQMQKAVL